VGLSVRRRIAAGGDKSATGGGKIDGVLVEVGRVCGREVIDVVIWFWF
jgi:hypothetical protein